MPPQSPPTATIYRQRPWTPAELTRKQFKYYIPVKRVSLVRRLPAGEGPVTITTPYDTILAEVGDYIAYVAGTELHATLAEYEPRPIEPHIFEATYLPWDDASWKPSPTEAHLLKLGCSPYYKVAGVWAKRLTAPAYVQSIESLDMTLVPPGAWLCIGSAGEPWSVTDEWFNDRYQV
jgi:hypothetical protein